MKQKGFVLFVVVVIILLVGMMILTVMKLTQSNGALLETLVCHQKIDQSLFHYWQSSHPTSGQNIQRKTLLPDTLWQLSIYLPESHCQRHWMIDWWPGQSPPFRGGFFAGNYSACFCDGKSLESSAIRSSNTKQSPL